MRSLPWHPSQGPSQGPSIRRDAAEEFDCPLDDRLLDTRATLDLMPADCCPACAAFRIVLPPADATSHRRELVLCAHHFRAGGAALERAAAVVFDAQGRLVSSHRPGAAW